MRCLCAMIKEVTGYLCLKNMLQGGFGKYDRSKKKTPNTANTSPINDFLIRTSDAGRPTCRGLVKGWPVKQVMVTNLLRKQECRYVMFMRNYRVEKEKVMR